MRVTGDDFNEIPAPVDVGGIPPVRVVTFDEFVGTEEETADALLGTAEETILPVGGTLLMYGDGGAGKTTLTVDAVAHMASGSEWLGVEVERAVRILIIENEGPRGKFRRKLLEKFASWNGHPAFNANVVVLEEPWTMFSLREETHRHALAVSVATDDIDLVVMGPLVTLGMIGGGTPDEVSEFEGLIRLTRSLVPRPVALWIVHHENKAGDVSGAWERVPDALIHVQAQGNGHTRVVFRKARWADERHGKALDLRWTETGRSYEVKSPDDRDYHADIIAAFDESDEWRTAKEVASLINGKESPVREALKNLVERGELASETGPTGRKHNAVCYRRSADPRLWDHQGSPGSPRVPGGANDDGDPGDPAVSRDHQITTSKHTAPAVVAGDPNDTSAPSF